MSRFSQPEDLPETIPLFPLPRALLLPRAQLPLTLFEPRYLAMAEAALKGARLIGMIQPRMQENPSPHAQLSLYPIGCVGRITSFTEVAENRLMVVLTGICRFRLSGISPTQTPYLLGEVAAAGFGEDFRKPARDASLPRQALLDVLRRYLKQNKMGADWKAIERTPDEMLVNSLSILSPFGVAEKQALLEAASLAERCRTLIALTEIALAGGGAATVQ